MKHERFSHMFIFQTRQFPRQLCRLDQWKCFVWSTKLRLFVKETWHVLVTWRIIFFNPYANVQLVKRDIHCSYHRHLLLHNDRVSLRETWLGVWRCLVWGKTFIDIFSRNFDTFDIFLIEIQCNWPQCQLLHTSMLKGESHVSPNVPQSLCNGTWPVDDSGNYVTFHKLNVRLIKEKKNDNSSQWELRSSVFQCDRFVQICLHLARPSFWSHNDTKLPKPLNTLLILSNMHSTWPERAMFLWQTVIVSCSKRNIFIGLVDTVVWETVSFEK